MQLRVPGVKERPGLSPEPGSPGVVVVASCILHSHSPGMVSLVDSNRGYYDTYCLIAYLRSYGLPLIFCTALSPYVFFVVPLMV